MSLGTLKAGPRGAQRSCGLGGELCALRAQAAPELVLAGGGMARRSGPLAGVYVVPLAYAVCSACVRACECVRVCVHSVCVRAITPRAGQWTGASTAGAPGLWKGHPLGLENLLAGIKLIFSCTTVTSTSAFIAISVFAYCKLKL